jgi:NADPH2:quinone reductase
MPRLGILADKGSLYVTRPTSAAYFRTAEEIRTAASALFNLIELGRISVAIDQKWPLAEAAAAQEALEARATTGSTLLLP